MMSSPSKRRGGAGGGGNGERSSPKKNRVWLCLLSMPVILLFVRSFQPTSSIFPQQEDPDNLRSGFFQKELDQNNNNNNNVGTGDDDDDSMNQEEEEEEEEKVDKQIPRVKQERRAIDNQNSALKINNNKKKTIQTLTNKTQTPVLPLKQSNRPQAFIHIGPPKTGSTSIETTMEKLRHLLESDNYVQPTFGDAPGNFTGKGVSANVAVCLCHYDDRECHPDLLQTTFPAFLKTALREKQNVLLSSEFFYTNRCDFDKMKQLFRGFDVTILVVYRHFHSWFKSVHYQSAVARIKSGTTPSPIILFASENNLDANQQRFAAFRFYEQTFGGGAIRVMDMDSAFGGGGLVPVFFCRNLSPKPAATCDKIEQEGEANTRNIAIPADYMRLVDEAGRSGMLLLEKAARSKRPRWAVNRCLAEQVQFWWEEQQNKTLADLPQSCITDEQFEVLKKATIEIHSELVPYIDTNVSIPELETSVGKKRSEFCSVEVPTILSTPEWEKMFAKLTPDCDN